MRWLLWRWRWGQMCLMLEMIWYIIGRILASIELLVALLPSQILPPLCLLRNAMAHSSQSITVRPDSGPYEDLTLTLHWPARCALASFGSSKVLKGTRMKKARSEHTAIHPTSTRQANERWWHREQRRTIVTVLRVLSPANHNQINAMRCCFFLFIFPCSLYTCWMRNCFRNGE